MGIESWHQTDAVNCQLIVSSFGIRFRDKNNWRRNWGIWRMRRKLSWWIIKIVINRQRRRRDSKEAKNFRHQKSTWMASVTKTKSSSARFNDAPRGWWIKSSSGIFPTSDFDWKPCLAQHDDNRLRCCFGVGLLEGVGNNFVLFVYSKDQLSSTNIYLHFINIWGWSKSRKETQFHEKLQQIN